MKSNLLNASIFILFICVVVFGIISVYVVRNANADTYGDILPEEYLSRCVTKKETAVAIAYATFKSIENIDGEFTFDAYYIEDSEQWQVVPNNYSFHKNYPHYECGIFISSYDGRVLKVNLQLEGQFEATQCRTFFSTILTPFNCWGGVVRPCQYIWSGGNIVAEITGDKIVTYLYGLNRISRKITGPKYSELANGYHEIYLYDGRGNVVQLVNEDITDTDFGQNSIFRRHTKALSTGGN